MYILKKSALHILDMDTLSGDDDVEFDSKPMEKDMQDKKKTLKVLAAHDNILSLFKFPLWKGLV